uniref:PDZ domain-containing protein n=1 Tax=Callorhinchus milii TaxID=7868 RepID=A0A4W3GDX4_CALMI
GPNVSLVGQRAERRPVSEPFPDKWPDGSHYDNTGFVADEKTAGMDTTGGGAGAHPMLSSKSRSLSAQSRRPLMRQDRIVGLPLELEQIPHTVHSAPDSEPPPPTLWQNWTRTPSPFEDRTAFPSKLDITPTDRFSHLCRPESAKVSTYGSRSSDRPMPMMRGLRASQFKKSQSIDEIDIGAFKVYNIPLDSYGCSIENPGSVDLPDPGPEPPGMSRSRSAPMLDEELLEAYSGTGGKGSHNKVPVTKKVYHFDHSFNPQGPIDVKPERRVTTSFTHNVDYGGHQGKGSSKEPVGPPTFRGYQPMDHMYSFSQPSVNDETLNPRFAGGQPSFLRQSDSLATSTEMMLHRRAVETPEVLQGERYVRTHYRGVLEHQNSASLVESQFLKRNGRFEEDYPTFQEVKNQARNFQDKPLTQRRPLSARSYSTETYGHSQARPVSARPTMAALMEKLPSDYNMGTYGGRKASESCELRSRPTQLKGEDLTSKFPMDWRQQLLRHIEAKRLDRVSHRPSPLLSWVSRRVSRLLCLMSFLFLGLRTPSQQSNVHDSEMEDLSPGGPWSSYGLGRRDVPPESIIKKAGSHPHPHPQPVGLAGGPQHRGREQQYEGAVSKVTLQHYQQPLQIGISSSQGAGPRASQPSRCLTQIKAQKSSEVYQEQFCVRIEKNPGLGFSISGGLGGQANPFKPSDMGIFITRVQPDGPASNLLQPGDKILKANGHNFVHMEHEKAVNLLKSFQSTVDLIIQREITA